MTLNPSNTKTEQSLYDFNTDIGAAGHATMDMQQLNSHTRTLLVDKTLYLEGSS